MREGAIRLRLPDALLLREEHRVVDVWVEALQQLCLARVAGVKEDVEHLLVFPDCIEFSHTFLLQDSVGEFLDVSHFVLEVEDDGHHACRLWIDILLCKSESERRNIRMLDLVVRIVLPSEKREGGEQGDCGENFDSLHDGTPGVVGAKCTGTNMLIIAYLYINVNSKTLVK